MNNKKSKNRTNYNEPLGKEIRFKPECREPCVPVYACQSDTTHPVVLQLSKGLGIITEARVEEILATERGVKAELNGEELVQVLEKLFGFESGNCEIHECEAIQKTRIGGRMVAGELRYTGTERMDNDWLDSGMASDEVKQYVKENIRYGGTVEVQEHSGTGNAAVESFLEGK